MAAAENDLPVGRPAASLRPARALLPVMGAVRKFVGKKRLGAGVAESADARDSKSRSRKGVRVQVPPPAVEKAVFAARGAAGPFGGRRVAETVTLSMGALVPPAVCQSRATGCSKSALLTAISTANRCSRAVQNN